MAGARFDGNNHNGWIIEQGGRFHVFVSVTMAGPNATAAKLTVYNVQDRADIFLTADESDHIAITNHANHIDFEIDIPATVTGALVHAPGKRYAYEFEFTESGERVKELYGMIPWQPEPGGL